MTDTAIGATNFAVVPDEVSDAGRYVQQTAANLIGGLRSASAEVDGLMSSWRGGAATAYAGAWDETHRAALDVFEALADMAELLGVVVDRTAATDTASAGTFGSLSLPPI
ncbi:WXG100 family type VII secretion target [Nocardia beijingensis]|uniref:WXG100 family type VII secretion target n=1 Tax=Nocardia beijingensis TaxID=95162 RepID=UPI0018949E53|nr:WXG100 family type VII secretion target [Nocardia beijingensis]MBF6077960.1 WXG100 family type VII secretion target [Nocardia beijingensis]